MPAVFMCNRGNDFPIRPGLTEWNFNISLWIEKNQEKLLTFVESFGMMYFAAENGGKIASKHISE